MGEDPSKILRVREGLPLQSGRSCRPSWGECAPPRLREGCSDDVLNRMTDASARNFVFPTPPYPPPPPPSYRHENGWCDALCVFFMVSTALYLFHSQSLTSM